MAEELSGMDFMSWAAGGLDTMDGTGFLTPLLIQESGSTSNIFGGHKTSLLIKILTY